jgi:hypothetical protein
LGHPATARASPAVPLGSAFRRLVARSLTQGLINEIRNSSIVNFNGASGSQNAHRNYKNAFPSYLSSHQSPDSFEFSVPRAFSFDVSIF